MLTQLREQTKFWMWIVGGAFMLTIVFAWGMDYTGGTTSSVLGKVNGESISIQEFQELYQANYRYQQQQMGGMEIDDTLIQYLQDQTWQQLITQRLIDQEIRRLGLGATNEEVVFALTNYPPAEIRSIPDLQTNGVFDRLKYDALMRNEGARGIWLQLEANMRYLIPEMKLRQMVTASVTVTDEEAKEAYRYRNETARAEFIVLDADTYPDTTLAVSDAEVRAYYESNREEYRRPERVDLNYAFLYNDPSSRDLLQIQRTLGELQDRLNAGETFDLMARQYSEDTTAPQGGDLGWIREGDMIQAFSDFAFGLEIGEIGQPLRTQYGWHIIEVDSIRTADAGVEERKVRHILLREQASPTTIDSLREVLDTLRLNATEEDFTTAATRLGVEVSQSGPVESGGFIPGIGFEPAAVRFGLRSRIGEISEVMENPSGFFLVQVRDKFAEGYAPVADVRDRIEATLIAERTLEGLKARGQQVTEALRLRPDRFRVAAEADGYMVQETGSITRGDYVGSIGRDAAFIAAAFKSPVGTVVGPIRGEDAWYIINLLERSEVTADLIRSLIRSEKETMLNDQKQSVFSSWLNGLMQKSKIVDNRSKYFG